MRTLLAILFLLPVLASAQQGPPQPDVETIRAINKLEFLFGEWEGTGWMQMGPGEKSEFTIKESIYPRAGGTIVSMQGLGKDKESGATGHDAFAVLTYDKATQEYNLRSYLVNGQHGDFPVTISKNKLVWQIDAGRIIRYTITLDEKGHWIEIGEVKMGERWFQFLEMKLKKVEA